MSASEEAFLQFSVSEFCAEFAHFLSQSRKKQNQKTVKSSCQTILSISSDDLHKSNWFRHRHVLRFHSPPDLCAVFSLYICLVVHVWEKQLTKSILTATNCNASQLHLGCYQRSNSQVEKMSFDIIIHNYLLRAL